MSLDGLRAHLEVDDLEGDWESVRAAVQDEDEPVIVTIANPNPLIPFVGDHAVVVWRIDEDDSEQVVYMDPLIGGHESMPLATFQLWWDTPGENAFVLRP